MCPLARFNPEDVDSIMEHLRCPVELEPRRREFATAVADAYRMVKGFAMEHGWMGHLKEPLFDSVEIFSTETELRTALGVGTEGLSPHSVLCAAIEGSTLMAVSPEEYRRLRPEYAGIDRAWTRLLAHELAHGLHARIAGGHDNMGPRWFYEAFAMYVAGQNFGLKVGSIDEAMAAIKRKRRGSYAWYVAALSFFVERVGIEELLKRAPLEGFERWLEERMAN